MSDPAGTGRPRPLAGVEAVAAAIILAGPR